MQLHHPGQVQLSHRKPGFPAPVSPPTTVSPQHLAARDTVAVSSEAFATLSTSTKNSVQYPVRLVYFVEGYSFGGVERHLLGLLDDLDRERFEPLVLGVMADELVPELQARHVPVVRLERIAGNGDVRGFARAFRAIRKARPVVFHAMLSHSHAAQYAIMSAVAIRTPVVVTTAHLPTQSESQMRRRLGRFILRGVDMQVLPSEWTKAELIRLDQLHGRSQVISNGIALPDLLSRQDARAQLDVPATATVIGGSMRLVDWKRPELITDAARGLPQAVVVILGEGPEEERLRSLAGDVDLRLPGFRLDAVSLLPALDVFIHPCPTDNQPLAVFEALASGVPVVVADRGGASLMVDDGRTGLRAPATSEGMGGAVRRLLDDPALAERLSGAGRAEVLERFTTQAMTRQLEELYERLLADASGD
jgi:glycosyltransferase involved in cell wall biosynthesis